MLNLEDISIDGLRQGKLNGLKPSRVSFMSSYSSSYAFHELTTHARNKDRQDSVDSALVLKDAVIS